MPRGKYKEAEEGSRKALAIDHKVPGEEHRHLRKEVAGDSPSPLEQLLADRVVVCWLQVSCYDGMIAQSREYIPAKVRMLQQHQDAAHRRYLSAIKTLATVRKLLTPARSPIEIASKLAGERSGLRLRQAPRAENLPVENGSRTAPRDLAIAWFDWRDVFD